MPPFLRLWGNAGKVSIHDARKTREKPPRINETGASYAIYHKAKGNGLKWLIEAF